MFILFCSQPHFKGGCFIITSLFPAGNFTFIPTFQHITTIIAINKKNAVTYRTNF